MIRGLGAAGEFCVVVFIAFAYPIASSLSVALTGAPQPPIDGAGLIGLIVYEFVVMAMLWPLLRMRGWTLAELGLANGRAIDVVLGLALALACIVATNALWLIAGSLGFAVPAVADAVPISDGLGWPAVVAISAVNPIFEEVFVCAYVIAALSNSRGPWLAIHVSVAIRLAYHLYQGSVGVVGILPMGLMSAYWYARTGRLWPVVVAHAALDFIALSRYA